MGRRAGEVANGRRRGAGGMRRGANGGTRAVGRACPLCWRRQVAAALGLGSSRFESASWRSEGAQARLLVSDPMASPFLRVGMLFGLPAMELKVWVDGVQRVVCGVSEQTTCQEVVIALAQAIGQTGRFVLVQRLREKERQLLPQECPVGAQATCGQFARGQAPVLPGGPPQTAALHLNAAQSAPASLRSADQH
ncbi:hypothetical protein MC885_012966 [Smutsia gigantea]|nr:hypothetical protein MC885_012966 [Smutsia gigantea]